MCSSAPRTCRPRHPLPLHGCSSSDPLAFGLSPSSSSGHGGTGAGGPMGCVPWWYASRASDRKKWGEGGDLPRRGWGSSSSASSSVVPYASVVLRVVVRHCPRHPLCVRHCPRRCPCRCPCRPCCRLCCPHHPPRVHLLHPCRHPRHPVIHVPSSSSSWFSMCPPPRRGRVVLILVVIYVRPRPCRAHRVAWIRASIGATKISNKSQHIFTRTWLFCWLFGRISFVSVARSQ